MGNPAKSSQQSLSTLTPPGANDGKKRGEQKLLLNPSLRRGSKSTSRVSKRQRSSKGSGSSAQIIISKSPSPDGATSFSKYSLSIEYEQSKNAHSGARTGNDGSALHAFLISQASCVDTREANVLVKNKQHSSSYLALLGLFNQFQGKRVDYNYKVLVTVTVLGTIGPLRMLLEGDTAVNNVIKATLDEYAREGRLPFLGFDCTRFDLHISQFSLQAIPPHACIKDLGTRNFVLCASKQVPLQILHTPCSFQVTRPWWSVLVNLSF
ncbi:hypothetical protein O6H91_16G024200 [Diphasiastrum complanatum]|uniref:Uncharacterized protein n=2 Tax=Diphasiastrum complanatum TaxID=34168 RepID=A0ACC2BAK7_DIPCM|nr:hypothetical protein O6H91_16G024200 [Diphasiastrum complanatum]KAJ7526820.1 hypothetical protein O6H91_16G024200 [Diphasiastrum complanatum]